MSDLLSNETMTVEGFLAWVREQSDGRYELAAGRVVALAPERAEHVRAKARIWRALDEAIRRSEARCEAFVDGLGVRVDETTLYQPDVLVHCGESLDRDEVTASNPVIVVEVLSPSTGELDTGVKLTGYFSVASIRHYLIVDVHGRRAVLHSRDRESTIVTRILATGILRLDPPAIELDVNEILGAL